MPERIAEKASPVLRCPPEYETATGVYEEGVDAICDGCGCPNADHVEGDPDPPAPEHCPRCGTDTPDTRAGVTCRRCGEPPGEDGFTMGKGTMYWCRACGLKLGLHQLPSRDDALADTRAGGDEAEHWKEAAAQHARNEEFWRGLVYEIGELFGDAAKTADDGTLTDRVLGLKVPELVREALTRAGGDTERLLRDLAGEECSNLDVGGPAFCASRSQSACLPCRARDAARRKDSPNGEGGSS